MAGDLGSGSFLPGNLQKLHVHPSLDHPPCSTPAMDLPSVSNPGPHGTQVVLELREGTGTRTGSETRLLDSLVCSRALQPHERRGGCQHPNLTTFITVPKTSEVPPRSQGEPTAHAPGMAVQGVRGCSVGISHAGRGAQERLARPHPGSPYPRSLRNSDGVPAAGAPASHRAVSNRSPPVQAAPWAPRHPSFPSHSGPSAAVTATAQPRGDSQTAGAPSRRAGAARTLSRRRN